MADVFDFYVYDNRRIVYEIAEPIMQEDNKVTDFQFHIPKVLNGLDVSSWAWWFVYVNARGEKHTEPIVLSDDPERPLEYNVATYSVDYGMSIKAGAVKFALEAINAEPGGNIINEWHTYTYQTIVKETLQGNQVDYDESQSDIISALITQIQNKYNQLVGGATPLPVNLKSLMTDHDKVYLYTGSEPNESTGYWYYYNGTQFVPGGLYGAGVQIDSIPTQGSTNAVSSGGVWDRFKGIESDISDKFVTIYSKNRFDPTNVENGYVNQATGAWVAGSTSYKGTSEMIDVLEAPFVVAFRRYAGTVNITFRYAVYDANGDYITGAIVPKEDFTIIDDYTDSHQKVGYLAFTDTRIKYIRFSISAGYFATLDVLITQGSTPPAYAPYSRDTNNAKGLQIMDRSVIGAKGVQMRYASVPVNATMRIGIENSLKKNKIYHLHTLINSSFSSLLFGHGEGAYSLYFSIDGANIVFMTNGTAGTTLAHGLTLDTYIDFMLIVGERNTGTIILNTLGGTYSHTVQIVQGYKGDVFVRAVGAALGETTIAFSSKDFRQPIWMFGDSYFTHTSDARWTYWLLEWGFGRCLLNGFPGANSDEALPQVVNYLGTWGIPKYIVWCLGMNDPDDGAINQTWMDCINELIAQCETYGVEPILATIPNVPSLDHTYKNTWVRESGYRYIDFAKAVGAESAGASWYTGALSTDNTHPSEIGARLLCQQAVLDVPELTM